MGPELEGDKVIEVLSQRFTKRIAELEVENVKLNLYAKGLEEQLAKPSMAQPRKG